MTPDYSELKTKLRKMPTRMLKQNQGVSTYSETMSHWLADDLVTMQWSSNGYRNDDQNLTNYVREYFDRNADTLMFDQSGKLFLSSTFSPQQRLTQIFGLLLDYLIRICYFDNQSIFQTLEKHVFSYQSPKVGNLIEYENLIKLTQLQFAGRHADLEHADPLTYRNLMRLAAFDLRYKDRNRNIDLQRLAEFDDRVDLDAELWQNLIQLYRRTTAFFDTFTSAATDIGSDLAIHSRYLTGEIDFYDPQSKTLIDMKSYGVNEFQGKVTDRQVPTAANKLQQLMYRSMSDQPIERLMLYNPLQDKVYYYNFDRASTVYQQLADQLIQMYDHERTRRKYYID